MKLPEKIILDFLNEQMNVPVYLEVQDQMPDEFILIERNGSSYEDFIYETSFIIQSYAKSMYKAAVLNEEMKRAMFKLVESDDVSSVTLNSDYNWTDTTKKHYRYQAIFEVVFLCDFYQ